MIKRYSLAILILVLLGLLFGCDVKKSDKDVQNIPANPTIVNNIQSNPTNPPETTSDKIQEKNDIILLRSVTERIHPSLPEFIFNIYGQEPIKSWYNYRIRKITIARADQPEKVMQEIILDKVSVTNDYPRIPNINTGGFYIEDMNFDGYKDIRLQLWVPAAPNIPFFYWIWDKDAAKFIQDKELEQIPSPRVDNENRTIVSYVRESAGTHSKFTYKYFGDHIKLIKISTVKSNYNKTVHITIRELKGDEMVIVSEIDKAEPIDVLKELE